MRFQITVLENNQTVAERSFHSVIEFSDYISQSVEYFKQFVNVTDGMRVNLIIKHINTSSIIRIEKNGDVVEVIEY